MKAIRFNTPDGQYVIDLELIAKHRAKEYFNENDSGYSPSIHFVMTDDFEGIDWLINNMDFEDIEDDAIKINDEVNVLRDDFWTDSDDFEIIEYNDTKTIK